MKYFLDSVKKEDMEKWFPFVEGITSNPYLLEKENLTIEQFFNNIISVHGWKNKKIFVQISSEQEALSIIDKTEQIHTYESSGMRTLQLFDIKNLIFKVMLHPKYYDLIKYLKKQKYIVATTTTYDIVQINQAIEFGVDYTMVYKHKNENPDLFKQAYKLKQISKSSIKLVGASFRGKHEVIEAMLSGMDYATATPQTLNEVFNNAQLEDEFNKLYAQI